MNVVQPKKNRIKLLPDHVINQIAAGEIVERPASIVKELLENSIDAGSSQIEITAINGGKQYISVVDDGYGLSKDQAMLAFERNATSKISTIEDLIKIETLGFRGEALPSIASVSRVVMKTRLKEKDVGVRLEFDNGRLKSVQEVGCPIGTSVEVFDLFKQVPARSSMLKNEATEFQQIQRIVGERVIAFHDLHFVLLHNNKTIVDTPGFGNFKDKLEQYLGDKIISNGIFFHREDDKTGIKLHGFLSSPFTLRKTKTYQFLYVNNRAVSSKMMLAALYNAYQPFIPEKNQHPIFVVFIESPPYFIDVNVHPTKFDVRFKNSNQVYKFILETISYQLNTSDFKPSFYKDNLRYEPKESYWSGAKPSNASTAGFKRFPGYQNDDVPLKRNFAENSKFEIIDTFNEADGIIPLSQFQNTYIIAKGKNRIILIDQHTAHERILYEKFLSELKEERISSQRYLLPIFIEVTPEDNELIINNKDIIRNSGFDVKKKSTNCWSINEAPVLLHESEIEQSFLNLVDDIRKSGRDMDKECLIDRMAKTLACHSAVRSGEELTIEKMYDLLNQLDKTKVPSVCPHGRPTLVELNLDEIEKIFKRK